MKPLCLIAVGLLSFFSASTTLAAKKYDFLNKSIMGDFSEADTASLRQTVGTLLNSEQDAKTVYWRGENGLQGKMQVALSYQSGAQDCRRVRFLFLNAKQKKEHYQFDLCRKEDATWQIQDTPLRYFSKADNESLKSSIDQVLNQNSVGQPISWNSSDHKKGGMIVANKSFQWQAQTCREVAISVYDEQNRQANGRYVFCLEPENEWQRNIDAELHMQEQGQ